jgi:hypothetical protein
MPHPLWQALEAAEHGGEPEAKILYTRGGCHAFAFAQAALLNGAAVLATEVAVPSLTGPFAKATIHAWCISGDALIDCYGAAESEEELLARLHKEAGWSPAFVKGTRAHKPACFSPTEIQLVLDGKTALPIGYFNEPGWLKRAMALIDRLQQRSVTIQS